jgi:hypothetical protein
MVNRYILIKTYNPAYSYWLRANLRKKRILGDREYSWKEAQQIIIDMDRRGTRDDVFEKYFSAWREHPEHPPDYFNLLRMVQPIDREDGTPDLTKIAELDEEARTRDQRIMFTIEDAAKDFYEFYDKFLTKPLTRDLEGGVKGKKLLRYFEYEEFVKIPDRGVHGEEKVQAAELRVGSELLDWLRAITPEKILADINSTLDQHYDKALDTVSPQHGYHHKSEYVEISAHKSEVTNQAVTTYAMPARGHRVVKEGYEDVYYPMYHVRVKLKSSGAGN